MQKNIPFMITHLQTNTWIKLLFIICLYLTISCNSNRKNTEKQTGIPSPKNLTAYFDSLQHHGFYIPYHSDSTDRVPNKKTQILPGERSASRTWTHA